MKTEESKNSPIGVCGFCGEERTLCESHILPAFVFRSLRGVSGVGHLRHTDNPNRRVQDGPKEYWLCEECEARFGRDETLFARNVFHKRDAEGSTIYYEDWLLRFCVSVSWRVLAWTRGRNNNAEYTAEQKHLMDLAKERWKSFLLGLTPHPAEFEQHLLIFGDIKQTNVIGLPPNFHRFLVGSSTLDIVGSNQSLMTFAKMGRYVLFGMIQMGSNSWQGTKIHVNHGVLKPDKFVIPSGIIDLLRSKARIVSQSQDEISSPQRNKIDQNIRNNIDSFADSEMFKAIQSDIYTFGVDRVFPKKE